MAVEEWACDVGQTHFQRLASIVDSLFGDPAAQSLTAAHDFFPTWHWLFTHRTPIGAKLALDGHPRARPAGVPEAFTQRLWAGSKIMLGDAPAPSETLTFRRRTDPAELKTGHSGALAFVPQTIEVLQGRRLVLTERRTGVYRPPVMRAEPGDERIRATRARSQPKARERVSREVRPDEITLFQYSALLGVSHRIHYDLAYAQQVEGYPALVVHGPLIAQLLVRHALASASKRRAAAAPLRALTVQAIAPALLGEPLVLHWTPAPDGGSATAWAEDGDQTIKMRVDLLEQ